jgi:hypothetical protein
MIQKKLIIGYPILSGKVHAGSSTDMRSLCGVNLKRYLVEFDPRISQFSDVDCKRCLQLYRDNN